MESNEIETFATYSSRSIMEAKIGEFILESFNTSESNSFFKLVDSNRPYLEDFFAGTVAFTQTPESTIDYCQKMHERRATKTYFPFILKNRSDGEFVGLVDVKNIDWRVPKAELGYFIDKGYEGQGLTTQAVGKVIDHIIPEYGFRKLICRVHPGNIGSIRVALKNSFELEGTIRRDYKTTRGEVVDLNYYGRLFD